MSIKGQGHSLTLVKGHSDFKVKCLTFGLYIQVSDSGPLGPHVCISAAVGKPGFRGISTFLVLKTEGLPHCEGRKMIKMNGYTFRGSNSVIFIVASHLNWGQLN